MLTGADMDGGAPAGEAELMERLRAGECAAYAELYREYAPALHRFVCGLRFSGLDPDDVVGEVFLRLLHAVRSGHGPQEHIRGYLTTCVRGVLGEWLPARREEPMRADRLGERAETCSARESVFRSGLAREARGEHPAHEAERELLARAFDRIPARWRAVLWRMEVEGHRPAGIAAEFGLSPNAVAVLAHRARRGLRSAYLNASSAEQGRQSACATHLRKCVSRPRGHPRS